MQEPYDPTQYPTLGAISSRADELFTAGGMSRGAALIQARDEARAVIAALAETTGPGTDGDPGEGGWTR